MSAFGSNIPGFGWVQPVYQLARNKTLAIPLTSHQEGRQRLIHLFKTKQHTTHGILFFKGGEQLEAYDTDTEILFRQDSWFNYFFGVKEGGFYGAISLSTSQSVLFIPRLDPAYRIWQGSIYPPEYFKTLYAVHEVHYVDEMEAWLIKELAQERVIHILDGINSDSGNSPKFPHFKNDGKFWSHVAIEKSILYNLASEVRVYKTEQEIQVMRYVAMVASNAHVAVMRVASKCLYEYELEAKFLYEIYANGGCRRCAYTSICGCGPNGAILHYGHAAAPNNRAIQYNDMGLLDMGAEYHGYVSDITCSYPVSGKFTADQKAIYEGVLNAQRAVYAHMYPGNSWVECHIRAERAILTALHGVGILINGSIDDFVDAMLGPVFFPHGLGHLIGCDTHDVGGYIPGTPLRSERLGSKKLRTARTLEPGMVLTNEPGCYFIDALIEPALADPNQSKFINVDVLNRFRRFGGVRIEDVVLVTANGPETLSTCPRTVDEIENVMAGGQWPPAVDNAPELKRRFARLAVNGQSMELLN